MPTMLVVCPVGWVGGAERILLEALKGHSEMGWAATVVFFESGPLVEQVEQLKVNTYVIPVGRLRQIYQFQKARRVLAHIIGEMRPSVVIGWMPKGYLYAGWGAIRRKIPGIWWQMNIPSNVMIDRWVSRIPATEIFALSRISAKAQTQLSKNPVRIVAPGTDLNQFAFDASKRAHFRNLYRIEEEAWVVGVVGRLEEWKRQDRAIRGFAQANIPNTKLVIAGGSLFTRGDGYERRLRQLVTELDIDNEVIFTGQVDDPSSVYSGIDVFLHTSDNEPFGMVVLEAAANERPIVIGTRSGGPLEVFTPGRDCFIYDSNNDNDLGNLLRRLYSNRQECSRIALEGNQTVKNNYSLEHFHRRFYGALEELTKESHRATERLGQ